MIRRSLIATFAFPVLKHFNLICQESATSPSKTTAVCIVCVGDELMGTTRATILGRNWITRRLRAFELTRTTYISRIDPLKNRRCRPGDAARYYPLSAKKSARKSSNVAYAIAPRARRGDKTIAHPPSVTPGFF